jgi:hypothetical protein
MSQTLMYLVDFADEVMPVTDCTPQGWAKWLAGPDREWGRDTAAQDGDAFRASMTRYEADIIARRVGGAWAFSREPAGAQLLACRFGPGLGWSAEHIVGSMDELRQWFADNNDFCDDVEYVAVGFEEPPAMARFHLTAEGPTLTLEPIS